MCVSSGNYRLSRLISVFSAIVFGFFFTGLAAAESSSCFIIEPYVVRATASEALVVWVVPAGREPGSLRLNTVGNDREGWFQAAVSTPKFQRRRAADLEYQRQLVALRELQPFTRYRYQVQCPDCDSVHEGRFMTVQEPGGTEPFDFVITTDGHADSGRYDGIATALGGLSPAPAFNLHTGDFSGGRGHDWGNWLAYFRVARPYLDNMVLWPVVGGHDVGPARNFRSLFAFSDPASDPAAEDNAATYYSFHAGNVHFIALDYTRDRELQLEWLVGELADSQADWKIVTLHPSIFNVGGRGQVLRGIYYDFARLFEQYAVDFVISGHDHIYERKLPIGSAPDRLVNYISFNSGGNYRRVRPSPIVAGGIGRNVYNYLYFTVAGRRLVMEARTSSGGVVDRLVLVKDEDGAYSERIYADAVELESAIELAHLFTGQDLSADLRYNRRDRAAEFLAFPVAGQELKIELDVAGFPSGSELVLEAQSDPDKWVSSRQVRKIEQETIEFELIGPANLQYGDGSLKPALELKLILRAAGREFEPVVLRPALGENTLAMLGLANIERQLGISSRSFSQDLVPAAILDLPESPSFDGNLRNRGAQLYFTWLDAAGDSLELQVRGGGISSSRYRNHGDFSVELYLPAHSGLEVEGEKMKVVGSDPRAGRQQYLIEGELVDSARVARNGQFTDIELTSDRKGLHLLHYDDLRDRTELQWGSGLPLTLEASRDHNPSSFQGRRQRQQNNWNLVFYVPVGTSTVDLHVRARQGVIHNASGDPVFDLAGRQGYFSIPVASGQDGALWQLRDYYGTEFYFLNIPPYLARSAKELLLPSEVVEADLQP